jgi:hypothetical protein
VNGEGKTFLQKDMAFTWNAGQQLLTIPHLPLDRWLRLQRRLVLMSDKDRTLEAIRREGRAALDGINLQKVFDISKSVDPSGRAWLVDSLGFFSPSGARNVIQHCIQDETDPNVKEHMRSVLKTLPDNVTKLPSQ